MAKEWFKAREILPALLVASIFTIIDFIIQLNAVIVLAQDDSVNMNPIIIHIHPQLSVVVNGKPFDIPEQIGIDPSLWNDHSLDRFGMRSMPEMNMSAMAPLHTHDNRGILHVESTIDRSYTLGEFLNVWGLNLNGDTVKMTVIDGNFCSATTPLG